GRACERGPGRAPFGRRTEGSAGAGRAPPGATRATGAGETRGRARGGASGVSARSEYASPRLRRASTEATAPGPRATARAAAPPRSAVSILAERSRRRASPGAAPHRRDAAEPRSRDRGRLLRPSDRGEYARALRPDALLHDGEHGADDGP